MGFADGMASEPGQEPDAAGLDLEGSRQSSLNGSFGVRDHDWEELDDDRLSASASDGYDDEEPKEEFTPDMIAAGLSHLGATAAGVRPAFLRLEVRGTSLCNPDPISNCVHLQEVVLADNCLTTLRSLGQLQDLTILDASNNRLIQVLDLELDPCCSSNLRQADLSFNRITTMTGLQRFSRLVTLRLDDNDIEYLEGLAGLSMLQQLSLCGNLLASCKGLEGLAHLKELALDDNQLRSIAPLASLPSLEVLSAANNRLQSLGGLEALSGLRSLDVRGNELVCLEELAVVQHAALLGELAIAGNPMEKALHTRLHVVHLLPQVSFLDGSEVTSAEKVDAANMHGADAGGLLAIRRRFFPDGELDDGGGAIPPTAAGLLASHAEEEKAAVAAAAAAGGGASAGGAAGVADAVLFAQVDAWAAAVPADALLEGGLAAVAAKLVAGCAKEGPHKQLQLARAVYVWVVARAVAPRAGASSWSVGQDLFGERGERLEEAVLASPAGTWAEKVALFFLGLARACHLEAVQLDGFYKDTGGRLQPGQRLSAHNHSWVAVKVNQRWRLLDPAVAVLRGGALDAPFFTPAEAFIFSHLPFEGFWQLLPEPLSPEQWWALPEISVPFLAAGMQLLEPSLKAVNTLPAPLEGRPLPALRLPIAIPLHQQERRRLSLQLLQPSSSTPEAAWSQPTAAHISCSATAPAAPATWPLVYQQPVAGPAGEAETEYGAERHACRLHELWASLPAPGEWLLQVVMETETPGLMSLRVHGLEQPLELALHECEVVVRCKVVVPSAQPRSETDQPALSMDTPPSALPVPTVQGWQAGMQLLQPPPCKRLEADRPELFEAECPGARAMAVGCSDCGWTQLSAAPGRPGHFAGLVVLPRAPACWLRALLTAPDLPQAAGAAAAPAAAAGVAGRAAAAVAEPSGRQASSSGSSQGSGPALEEEGWVWTELLALKVEPQVQHVVEVPPADPLLGGKSLDPLDPALARARHLLEALDVNSDSLVTRKEMLLAFRRNRQLADFLKMPPRIKVADGTFDRFLAGFIAINKDGLGYVDLAQLAAYLGVRPSDVRNASFTSHASSSFQSTTSDGRTSGRPNSGASQYSRVSAISAMRKAESPKGDRHSQHAQRRATRHTGMANGHSISGGGGAGRSRQSMAGMLALDHGLSSGGSLGSVKTPGSMDGVTHTPQSLVGTGKAQQW